jgi:Sec-independent protein translocase protein TatA
MLGIGFAEILVIALVAFVALGPEHLPSLMKKLAQLYRQWTGLRDDLRFQIMNADDGLLDDKKTEVKKQNSPDSFRTMHGEKDGP